MHFCYIFAGGSSDHGEERMNMQNAAKFVYSFSCLFVSVTKNRYVTSLFSDAFHPLRLTKMLFT